MPLSPDRQLSVARTFSAVAGALPWGSGQYHLARPLISPSAWPAGFSAQQTLKSGARVQLDLSDRTQLVAFLLRDYSPEISSYLDARLPPGGTLFDVGGNVGMVTFGLAARRPDVRVHAFEPNPANIEGWRRNHLLNPRADAVLTERAVSAHDGELAFRVPHDSGSGMVDARGTEIVRSVSIDSYCEANGIEHIDVVKVDVQGHEPAVIVGARRMLAEGRIDTFVCEVDEPLLAAGGHRPSDIIDPLRAAGFEAKPLPDVRFSRRLHLRRDSDEDLVFERCQQ